MSSVHDEETCKLDLNCKETQKSSSDEEHVIQNLEATSNTCQQELIKESSGKNQEPQKDVMLQVSNIEEAILDGAACNELIELTGQLSLVEKENKPNENKSSNDQANDNDSRINDLLQLDDLFCPMCMEIVVKPTILGCAHVFCQWCIDSWTRVHDQCPTCREKVSVKIFCKSFDEFVKKLLDMGPRNLKEEHELLDRNRTQQGLQVFESEQQQYERYMAEFLAHYPGYYVL